MDRDLESAVLDDELRRLVDWNVEILARSLTLITAHRQADNHMRDAPDRSDSIIHPEGCAIDEVTEIIELPEFKSSCNRDEGDGKVELAPEILKQLHTYVTAIASMYRNNPFHNFEHASHVCMSVQVSVIFLCHTRARGYLNRLTLPSNAPYPQKLLSRIVQPDAVLDKQQEASSHFRSLMHDHTYGITSDPLTQFACIFSALIHDGKRIDLCGVHPKGHQI